MRLGDSCTTVRWRRSRLPDEACLLCAVSPPVVVALGENGAQNAPAVTDRIQVADAVDPRVLKARYLFNFQVGLGDTDVDQGLHLESVAPQSRAAAGRDVRFGVKAEHRDVTPPENVVSVAEI